MLFEIHRFRDSVMVVYTAVKRLRIPSNFYLGIYKGDLFLRPSSIRLFASSSHLSKRSNPSSAKSIAPKPVSSQSQSNPNQSPPAQNEQATDSEAHWPGRRQNRGFLQWHHLLLNRPNTIIRPRHEVSCTPSLTLYQRRRSQSNPSSPPPTLPFHVYSYRVIAHSILTVPFRSNFPHFPHTALVFPAGPNV